MQASDSHGATAPRLDSTAKFTFALDVSLVDKLSYLEKESNDLFPQDSSVRVAPTAKSPTPNRIVRSLPKRDTAMPETRNRNQRFWFDDASLFLLVSRSVSIA